LQQGETILSYVDSYRSSTTTLTVIIALTNNSQSVIAPPQSIDGWLIDATREKTRYRATALGAADGGQSSNPTPSVPPGTSIKGRVSFSVPEGSYRLAVSAQPTGARWPLTIGCTLPTLQTQSWG
jgi:hypothetical protein